MENDNDKLVRDVLGEDAGTFQELVEAVLNNECVSTPPADPKVVKRFVPEEEDCYKISRLMHFGITKPTFCNLHKGSDTIDYRRGYE